MLTCNLRPLGDLCCYLVLSHATSHGPFASHFQGLLVASCFLDVLQALTTSFRYHYLPIQLAGFSMRRAYQAESTEYRD